MTAIRNTEKKFFRDEEGNMVLNPYWKGLVENDEYVCGFLDGLNSIKPVVENAPEEISDSSKTVEALKKEIAEDVSEEILLQMGYIRNQVIVSAIDSLDEPIWSARCQKVLDNLSEEEKKLNPIHPNDAEGNLAGEWE